MGTNIDVIFALEVSFNLNIQRCKIDYWYVQQNMQMHDTVIFNINANEIK